MSSPPFKTMTTPTIQFNSEAERKTFSRGLKIATTKIEAARKTNPTAEQISDHHIKVGNAIIAKRLESAQLTKTLEAAGISTKDFKAIVKTAAADTLKSFRTTPTKPTPTAARRNRKDDGETHPRSTRFLSVSAGTYKNFGRH
jgi:hypothetical protein